MFFNKLCKKVLALGLATVLSAGMITVADGGNVAKAEETVKANLFDESKLYINELGDFYDLTYSDIDENGYIKNTTTSLYDVADGTTFIEYGYDMTYPGQLADGIVDIEGDALEARTYSFTFNIIRVENDKLKVLERDIDYKMSSEKNGDIMRFKLEGMGNYTGAKTFDIKVFDDIEFAVFRNESLVDYMISKLYEKRKAVRFSLDPNAEFVDFKTFIKANEKNMIDADNYDMYYKTKQSDEVKKARLVVCKYVIQDDEIIWNTKKLAQIEYDGKAHNPVVTKIALSKSKMLVGASDITQGFTYAYHYIENIGKENTKSMEYIKDCTKKGYYLATVMLINNKNYRISYPEKDGMVMCGVLPFTIANAKTSIAKAKVTFKKATYNKANQKAKIDKVVLGNKTLKEGKDYTVENVTKKNAGTYKVKITGKGNYKGTVTGNFVIARKSLLKCRDIKAAYMIADGNTILTVNKDFKPVKQNKKYYVVGIGNYTGKRQVSIVLKKAKKK